MQFLLAKLIPVISAAPQDEIAQATELAHDHANAVLSGLQFDADDVQDVLASIRDFRSEILGEAGYAPRGALH